MPFRWCRAAQATHAKPAATTTAPMTAHLPCPLIPIPLMTLVPWSIQTVPTAHSTTPMTPRTHTVGSILGTRTAMTSSLFEPMVVPGGSTIYLYTVGAPEWITGRGISFRSLLLLELADLLAELAGLSQGCCLRRLGNPCFNQGSCLRRPARTTGRGQKSTRYVDGRLSGISLVRRTAD